MNALIRDTDAAVSGIQTTRIMVLIADDVSLTTLSATLEPFHHANAILGGDRFTLQLVSLRDTDPVTMAGIPVACNARAAEVLAHCDILQRPDQVILCCGQVLAASDKKPMQAFVQKLHHASVPFFALGAACSAVVAAGLIREGTCAAHWKTIAPLSECFGDHRFENVLFARNGKITSCAGELAAFDLIVEFIESICGPRVSGEICNHFLASGTRSGATVQLLNGDAMICEDARFQKILRIMTDTIESPVPISEIARQIGLCTRQIERIFARNGFDPPLKYYTKLRLTRAQQLLEQTQMSLSSVALACGFESLSAFAKNYKRVYGMTPKMARARFVRRPGDHSPLSAGGCT